MIRSFVAFGIRVEKIPLFRHFPSVRPFGSSSLSLAGSLLIAHPSLLDPNFRRSVLFLSESDPEEGSFALALTRPSGRKVSDLLPEKDLGKLSSLPVFVGGPVATDQLIFASFEWHRETNRLECRHHLVITDALEQVENEAMIVRAFVGYAGWTKGQLEGELAQRAWMVCQPPDSEVLQLDRCHQLWRDILSSFGPAFRLAAEAPDDPSMN